MGGEGGDNSALAYIKLVRKIGQKNCTVLECNFPLSEF
jgi:hypothetical protein